MLAFLMSGILLLSGCENDPKDLGLNYIPSIDTTGVKYLDSQADTMNIRETGYRKNINTYLSENLLIGNYNNYQSKSLLRFYNITKDYDSSKVISAILKLRYGNYYFKDKSGNTSFNIYKVLRKLNYASITIDSVSSSDFGTVSQGNFNGTVPDSSYISIPMDNNLIKSWLEYAADTSLSEKNYGLALVPNASSTTIKGFYLINNNVDYIPSIEVILTKNGNTDTITLNTSDGLYLTDAPVSVIPTDRIFLQNGIAFRNRLNFDLSKLPSNVIINNATLLFTLDNSSSFISANTDKRIIIGMMTDTVNNKDTIFAEAFLRDTITYSVSLNAVFQRWNSGIMLNLGLSMKNYFELQNLDNFAIYNQFADDVSKRPRIKITYTLRN